MLMKNELIIWQKLRQVVTTVEEMWETEPDGRLTASCAAERFRKLLDQPESQLPMMSLSDRPSDVEKTPLMAKLAEEVV